MWGLAVLGMVALIVVAFLILFTGGKSGGNNDGGSTSYGSSAFGNGRSSHPHKPSASRSASQSTSAAAATGDAASLAAAINALRARHGLSAVTASVSSNAQACAAAHGGGATCVPHYIYAVVANTDGPKVAQALADVNETWLLAKDATRIEIGFAVDAKGGYDCAVLRFP